MNDLEPRVIKTIARQLHIDELSVEPGAAIADDLGADSLDSVELIMALEDEFEIVIPDEDAAAIKTVRQAVDYVALAIATSKKSDLS